MYASKEVRFESARVGRVRRPVRARGLIRREPGKARSLKLLAAPEELPILR